MREWVARNWDKLLQQLEEKYLQRLRKEVLSDTEAKVCLELGAGTGTSIGAWPANVQRLVMTEPCDTMRKQLERKVLDGEAAGAPVFPAKPEILNTKLEGHRSLPFENNTFDTVLISLLFCGIDDQRESCRELRRVMKPGGKICFIEHVAPEGGIALFFTKLLNSLWAAFYCCSATKNTHVLFKEQFDEVKFKKFYLKVWESGLPNLVVYGTGVNPAD